MENGDIEIEIDKVALRKEKKKMHALRYNPDYYKNNKHRWAKMFEKKRCEVCDCEILYKGRHERTRKHQKNANKPAEAEAEAEVAVEKDEPDNHFAELNTLDDYFVEPLTTPSLVVRRASKPIDIPVNAKNIRISIDFSF